jgi:hypothetical protein
LSRDLLDLENQLLSMPYFPLVKDIKYQEPCQEVLLQVLLFKYGSSYYLIHLFHVLDN